MADDELYNLLPLYMAVTTPLPPITHEAGTLTLAVDAEPFATKSAEASTASTTFSARNDTTPVGTAPAALPRTVAVRCTVSSNPAFTGSAMTVVMLAVARSHWVTRL